MCKWSKVHPAQGWLAKLILLESWPLVGEWNSGPLNGQAIWDYWLLGYFFGGAGLVEIFALGISD